MSIEVPAALAASAASEVAPQITHMLIRLLTHRISRERALRLAEDAPRQVAETVLAARAEIEEREGRLEDLSEDRMREYVEALERFANESHPHADAAQAADALATLRAASHLEADLAVSPRRFRQDLTRVAERTVLAYLNTVAPSGFEVRRDVRVAGDGPTLSLDAVLVDKLRIRPEVLVEVQTLPLAALRRTAKERSDEALGLLVRYKARTQREARLWMIFLVDERLGRDPLEEYLTDVASDVAVSAILPDEISALRFPQVLLAPGLAG
jgi:hypothetical protein